MNLHLALSFLFLSLMITSRFASGERGMELIVNVSFCEAENSNKCAGKLMLR